MRIPFPLTLNVGTDIIAYRRLLRPTATSNHLQRLASRFLHPQELCDLTKRFPDWRRLDNLSPEQQTKIGVHLAGRWAAKEAAKKAWGATLLSFKDLRVESTSDGQVQIICQSFKDAQLSPNDQSTHKGSHEQVAKLSISHDGDYAVATVIATPLHPDILAELRNTKADADSKVTDVMSRPPP